MGASAKDGQAKASAESAEVSSCPVCGGAVVETTPINGRPEVVAELRRGLAAVAKRRKKERKREKKRRRAEKGAAERQLMPPPPTTAQQPAEAKDKG